MRCPVLALDFGLELLGCDTEVASDLEPVAAHAKALRDKAAREPDPREWVPMRQHQAVAQELARLQAQIAKDKAEAAVRQAMSAGKQPRCMSLLWFQRHPLPIDWAEQREVLARFDA